MAAQPDDMAGPRAADPRVDDDRIVLHDDRDPVAVDDPEVGRHRADADGRLLTDEPADTDEPAVTDERAVTEEPAAVQEPVAVPTPVADQDPLADDEDPLADDEPAAVPGDPSATGGTALAGDRPDTIPAAALAEQQWPAIQSLFVDDPRGAVERAAAAAGEVAASLVATLEREQAELRASWQRDTDTEGLRTALQRYRAFCGRVEGLA
jgi:hypothetical protein